LGDERNIDVGLGGSRKFMLGFFGGFIEALES
jgi:hypothetical protein